MACRVFEVFFSIYRELMLSLPTAACTDTFQDISH